MWYFLFVSEISIKDYIGIHRGSLNAIVDAAENLLSSEYERITVAISGESDDAVITEGEYTVDEVCDIYEAEGESITPEDAEEVLWLYGNRKKEEAGIAINGLHGLVSLGWSLDQFNQGLMTQEEAAQAGFLAYKEGMVSNIYLTDSLSAKILKLSGVEQVGDAAQYVFEESDDFVTSSISVDAIGKGITGVNTKINPKNDDIRRWGAVLGKYIADVPPILLGPVLRELKGLSDAGEQSAQPLDDALEALKSEAADTVAATDLAQTLEEIRERAIALRESTIMQRHFGATMSLPTADVLQEWVDKITAF